MADPVLRLDSTRVSVEPGGQAQIAVTITSSSSIVEGFALDVVGTAPARWAEVIPPVVNVYPGAEAAAVVVFSPPPGAAAQSGTFPFGVRARSTEDANASAVAEGDVTLGKVSGLQAKIVPVTSAGRWRGRHTIQLSNWGNTPVQLRMVASDPDEALGFYLRPDLVDLPLGGTATVRMTVRTRRPFLRGTPTRLPFQVIGEPADAPPGPRAASPYGDPSRPVVDGALNQKPILSKAFVTLVAVLLVAAVGGGAYAFTRKPPAPTSLEQLGTPDQPKNFVVEATGPTAIKASWTRLSEISGYQLLDIDPVSKVPRANLPINGSLGQTAVESLLPDTDYCYQLLAQRESKVGPVSELACVKTPPAPPSPTPTPTPSPTPEVSTPPATPPETPGATPPPGGPTAPASTPGGAPTSDPLAGGAWVVVAGVWPQEAVASTVADARVAQLQSNGFPKALPVDSTRYPNLKLIPTSPLKPSWLAVVGPYPTKEAADGVSGQLQKVIEDSVFVVQPDPPQ